MHKALLVLAGIFVILTGFIVVKQVQAQSVGGAVNPAVQAIVTGAVASCPAMQTPPILPPCPVPACRADDCAAAAAVIPSIHQTQLITPQTGTLDELAKRFFTYHKKFNENFMAKIVIHMREIATAMSAVGEAQGIMVGSLFDAKDHLEAERVMQELKTETFKNYKPSESFCAIGTNTRALSTTQLKSRAQTQALDHVKMKRNLGALGTASSNPASLGQVDKFARFVKFTRTTCDKTNNYFDPSAPDQTGLSQTCQGSPDHARLNRDINFTRSITMPRTLEVDLMDGVRSAAEEDLLSLSANLYGHDVIPRNIDFSSDSDLEDYLRLRSITARRSVAQHSFNAIVGMKAQGSTDPSDPDKAYSFLAAIWVDLGVPDAEIKEMIGEKPSYYAQMEVLSKKMLQSPNFYTWLIDKTVNVKRKEAALAGIELMLDRALFESELRQEMVMSVLLSTELGDNLSEVEGRLR